jgi:hypothetical protein
MFVKPNNILAAIRTTRETGKFFFKKNEAEKTLVAGEGPLAPRHFVAIFATYRHQILI